MINKFESWRKAKQAQFDADAYDMHFHRCTDSSFGVVRSLLERLSVAYIEGRHAPVTLQLSSVQVDAFLAFLNQMQFAYIHPRSTSHRFLMVRESKLCSNSSTY